MHEGGEPFCYPCLAFKQRGLGRESRPWHPGTHTIHRQAVAYTSVLLFSPHRFLQRLEKVHRAPCASETHRRKAQVRPQAESHPREGLPSSDGPPSGVEAGSTACPAISRPTLAGKACSGGGQAGPSLCPLPTALCPPHTARRRKD
ncbi:Uncharacterised protein [Chlamydia abortus]|nr:Uncharacterised protein [Chlamydia abortus]